MQPLQSARQRDAAGPGEDESEDHRGQGEQHRDENRSRNSGRNRIGSPTERPRRSAATARASAFVSCGPSLLRRAARHLSGIVRLTWRKGKQGQPRPAYQHGSPSHALSLDVCKTENPTRDTTHGGAGLEAPWPVCHKRPFTTPADRLRPRLEGGRLPVAGPAARRATRGSPSQWAVSHRSARLRPSIRSSQPARQLACLQAKVNTVSVIQRLKLSLSMNCLNSSASSLMSAVMTRVSALPCSMRALS